MKRPWVKLATHLAIFGLVVVIAISARRVQEGAAGADDGKHGSAVASGRPDRPGRSSSRKGGGAERDEQKAKFSSRDFKSAWDAIAFRNVSMRERTQLQEEVLRQWAEVDLEAAVKALLAGNWDPEAGYAGVDNVMASFDQVFRDRPLEAWDLINSGKLGLGSILVKDRWAKAVAAEHPMLVMSHFNDLPSRSRGDTLKAITAAVVKNPELRDEFLTRFCEQPQNSQFSTWMSETIRTLGPSGTPAELGEKLSNAKTDQERTRYVHEFGVSLKGSDFGTMLAEWRKLPPEIQGRATNSMLFHADPTADVPKLVGLMVEIGEWKSINDQIMKVSEYGYKTGKAAELAQWTASLPDVPQANRVFVQAVEPYIVNNPVAAKSWIESLPANDWRRDKALAEYSRHVLWRMSDRDLSTWAINSISDPQMKKQVVSVRAAWARERGVDP
ncbi:MAG TPA: hypothetical protein VM511_07785 [Luteolibacter sp.]|nr:hypothetical protein [Luteolibacter sp.]